MARVQVIRVAEVSPRHPAPTVRLSRPVWGCGRGGGEMARDDVLRCGQRITAPSRPYGLQLAVEGALLQGVEEVVELA